MSRFEFDPMTHEPFRQEPPESVGEGDSLLDRHGEPDWHGRYELGADDVRDQRAQASVPTGGN